MKYHPLALMIAIVLAQGCSIQQKEQQKEQQAELLPAPPATQVLTDKKDFAQPEMRVEEATFDIKKPASSGEPER